MECVIQGCSELRWGGRTLCRAHIEADTQGKIGLLASGKITREEILKDLVPVPAPEEISQAMVDGASV
jgi:hypothetical protein